MKKYMCQMLILKLTQIFQLHLICLPFIVCVHQVPGLGALKGDHFAVALPFDKSKDATIRSGMDKTRFPRAAALESLLRYVIHDLETPRK